MGPDVGVGAFVLWATAVAISPTADLSPPSSEGVLAAGSVAIGEGSGVADGVIAVGSGTELQVVDNRASIIKIDNNCRFKIAVRFIGFISSSVDLVYKLSPLITTSVLSMMGPFHWCEICTIVP